jgi:hypothetical protein
VSYHATVKTTDFWGTSLCEPNILLMVGTAGLLAFFLSRVIVKQSQAEVTKTEHSLRRMNIMPLVETNKPTNELTN